MKKFLKVLMSIVTTIIVVFTVFVMLFTVISFNTVGKEDATLLGYKPNIVLTDSMRGAYTVNAATSEIVANETEEGGFTVGDIAVSKTVDPETLNVGDIITFRSIDPNNYQEIITHKIAKIDTYKGELAFVTFGTTTGVEDAYPVPASQVLGKYSFHLPKMGYFFQFLKTPTGYFSIILIPFLLLIAIQAVKFFRLVKKYRSEQQEELNAQRNEMEAERAKAQEMMDELARLRAQLSDQGDGQPAEQPVAVAEAVESQPAETEGE
ncbi:MAG: signal peptidase I [Clostridia bacterium]|nr:signal peptidase I [Clostridia bacterium]